MTGSAEGRPQRSARESSARGLAAFARELWLERRARCHFLPQELFGEPAWDLLLDCFAASPCAPAPLQSSAETDGSGGEGRGGAAAGALQLLRLGMIAPAPGGQTADFVLTPETREAMGKVLSAMLLRRATAAPATWGEAFPPGKPPAGMSERDARFTLVTAKLLDCLDELDRLDLFEAGAHLSLALDALGREPPDAAA